MPVGLSQSKNYTIFKGFGEVKIELLMIIGNTIVVKGSNLVPNGTFTGLNVSESFATFSEFSGVSWVYIVLLRDC